MCSWLSEGTLVLVVAGPVFERYGLNQEVLVLYICGVSG